MNKQMTQWKKRLSAKRLIFLCFLISVCFFSCNKSSEKPEENTSISDQEDLTAPANIDPEENAFVSDQKDLTEPADTDIVDLEPEKKPYPFPESVVPEEIRRPQQGEAPRYPEDSIIGLLGPGEASAASFYFAQELLRKLLQEESRLEELSNLPPREAERAISILQKINPEKVRIGGGQRNSDGSVSFLLRFIGTDSWSGGEIYLRQNETVWDLEDLILDDAGEHDQSKSPYRFDFPPYERFF